MINDLIKRYKGTAIYDHSGTYSFPDLFNQVLNYDKIINKKINDYENVILLSNYNFFL